MIEKLINKNEGKTLEFKKTVDSKSLVKTVVAFANTAGGSIVIGLEDGTKSIVGVENVLEQEERIASLIADTIKPLLIPDIEITSYRERALIIIKVPHTVGSEPYHILANGQKVVYIRMGSTNRKADIETLEALYRLSKHLSYDELPCIGASSEEIDSKFISEKFIAINRPINKKQYVGFGIFKEHFGKQYPTHAGILLFGKERPRWFPDSIIRCVKYEGTDRTYIIDQLEIESNLIISIEEIINFIKKHSKVSAIIGETVRRDLPEYSPIALREIVINAILHADYSLKGSSIQVAIFSDRLEITNPGALPFGQTLDSALSGISRLRNRTMGRLLQQLKLVERLGSGLQRVLSIYRDTRTRTPLFEEKDNHFRVSLFPYTQEKSNLTLEERKLAALLYVKEKAGTKEISKHWEVTDRTARTWLAKMSNKGVIQRMATSEKDPNAVFILTHHNAEVENAIMLWKNSIENFFKSKKESKTEFVVASKKFKFCLECSRYENKNSFPRKRYNVAIFRDDLSTVRIERKYNEFEKNNIDSLIIGLMEEFLCDLN
ncbi:MAG TPA: ATP-binding protein [Coxiellaceae bacterium]|nr:ATP-binding protein [Coxiellaceae bacterium]